MWGSLGNLDTPSSPFILPGATTELSWPVLSPPCKSVPLGQRYHVLGLEEPGLWSQTPLDWTLAATSTYVGHVTLPLCASRSSSIKRCGQDSRKTGKRHWPSASYRVNIDKCHTHTYVNVFPLSTPLQGWPEQSYELASAIYHH